MIRHAPAAARLGVVAVASGPRRFARRSRASHAGAANARAGARDWPLEARRSGCPRGRTGNRPATAPPAHGEYPAAPELRGLLRGRTRAVGAG